VCLRTVSLQFAPACFLFAYGSCRETALVTGGMNWPNWPSAQSRRRSRGTLTFELTALFGFAIGHYEEKGAFISDSHTFAGGLRFDRATMGKSRPYVEIGGAVAPGQRASYQRTYMTGAGIGIGTTRTSNMSIYARAGWMTRLTPATSSRAAPVSAIVGRPRIVIPKQPARAIRSMHNIVAGWARQVWRARRHNIRTCSANESSLAVDATVSRSFGSQSSIGATIAGFGQANVAGSEITCFEPGTRVSFRVSRHVKVDAFINATVSDQSIGTCKHGGFGVNVNL
jgi:hypothetical protein